MKHTITFLTALLLAPLAALHAATINLAEPLDYQVIQRTSPATGTVRLRGTLTNLDANGATWEVRIVANGKPGDWQRIAAKISQNDFEGTLAVPAGGWYRLEVRVMLAGAVAADAAVEHVGVGEVLVVAGQSNCTRTPAPAALPAARLPLCPTTRSFRPYR